MTQVISPEIGISSEEPEIIKSPGDEFYGIRYEGDPYKGKRNGKFGVAVHETGCNFAIRVRDAKGVDLCMPPDPDKPSDNGMRWRLEKMEDTPDGAEVWGVFIQGAKPGDKCYYRADRDDPRSYTQPLLDPYAEIITRDGHPDHPNSPAYFVIPTPELNTEPVEHVTIDPRKRVIYETHIADATMNNLDIPEELRGTYLGFAHPSNIAELKQLGITTVEIQPFQQFFAEQLLANRGMVNHWGYNTVGFLAAHEGYATETGKQREECRAMIKALHEAGIEVVLDVVYNHTADGPLNLEIKDEYGNVVEVVQPRTYSLRGLDNEGYYKTYTKDNGEIDYWDTTGCGNTVDSSKPAAAQLILDSLIYWRNEMGIDGARFDLAPSVGDDEFFKRLKAHPDLDGMLMIAEPWSWGAGYPKTTFAKIGMAEWNGADFRDPVRDFMRGEGNLDSFTYAMEGSYDPRLSVNFFDAHDGFTMLDAVSYNIKHNKDNGENGRDGEDHNRTWNHGFEGEPEDETHREYINKLRQKTLHNIVNTLFMSWGIAMWLGGDEKLHTQYGNNNAYCRDAVVDPSDTEFVDIHSRPWKLDDAQRHMYNTVKNLIALRQQGSMGDPNASKDRVMVRAKDPDTGEEKIVQSPIDERGFDRFSLWGQRVEKDDRYMAESRVIGVYSSGIANLEESGDTYLTYMNGSQGPVNISLPHGLEASGKYALVSDAETGETNPNGIKIMPEIFTLGAMSSVVLKRISSRLPEREQKVAPMKLRSIENLISFNPYESSERQHLPQDGELAAAA